MTLTEFFDELTEQGIIHEEHWVHGQVAYDDLDDLQQTLDEYECFNYLEVEEVYTDDWNHDEPVEMCEIDIWFMV